MFQNLSYEDIELVWGLFAVVVFFIAIVINGIVIAIKEGKRLRKSEKQKQLNQTDEN